MLPVFCDPAYRQGPLPNTGWLYWPHDTVWECCRYRIDHWASPATHMSSWHSFGAVVAICATISLLASNDLLSLQRFVDFWNLCFKRWCFHVSCRLDDPFGTLPKSGWPFGLMNCTFVLNPHSASNDFCHCNLLLTYWDPCLKGNASCFLSSTTPWAGDRMTYWSHDWVRARTIPATKTMLYTFGTHVVLVRLICFSRRENWPHLGRTRVPSFGKEWLHSFVIEIRNDKTDASWMFVLV